MNVTYTDKTITKVSKLFQAAVADNQFQIVCYMLKQNFSLAEVPHTLESTDGEMVQFNGLREVLEHNKALRNEIKNWIRNELQKFLIDLKQRQENGEIITSEIQDMFDSFFDDTDGFFKFDKGYYMQWNDDYQFTVRDLYKEYLENLLEEIKGIGLETVYNNLTNFSFGNSSNYQKAVHKIQPLLDKGHSKESIIRSIHDYLSFWRVENIEKSIKDGLPTGIILERLFDRNQHKLVQTLKFFDKQLLKSKFFKDCTQCWPQIWKKLKQAIIDNLEEFIQENGVDGENQEKTLNERVKESFDLYFNNPDVDIGELFWTHKPRYNSPLKMYMPDEIEI